MLVCVTTLMPVHQVRIAGDAIVWRLCVVDSIIEVSVLLFGHYI